MLRKHFPVQDNLQKFLTCFHIVVSLLLLCKSLIHLLLFKFLIQLEFILLSQTNLRSDSAFPPEWIANCPTVNVRVMILLNSLIITAILIQNMWISFKTIIVNKQKKLLNLFSLNIALSVRVFEKSLEGILNW